MASPLCASGVADTRTPYVNVNYMYNILMDMCVWAVGIRIINQLFGINSPCTSERQTAAGICGDGMEKKNKKLATKVTSSRYK